MQFQLLNRSENTLVTVQLNLSVYTILVKWQLNHTFTGNIDDLWTSVSAELQE